MRTVRVCRRLPLLGISSVRVYCNVLSQTNTVHCSPQYGASDYDLCQRSTINR